MHLVLVFVLPLTVNSRSFVDRFIIGIALLKIPVYGTSLEGLNLIFWSTLRNILHKFSPFFVVKVNKLSEEHKLIFKLKLCALI